MANFPIEIRVKLTYSIIGVIVMAEFCWECFNKVNERKYSRWRYALSLDPDLCEECGQWKRVVVRERKWLLRLFPFLR